VTQLQYTRLPIRPSNDDLFRGRTENVKRLLRHLPKAGVSAVIYGERGIGKTSLALQVMSALEGSTSKFQKFLKTREDSPQFKCIAIKGLSAPTNRNDLLVSAITFSGQDRSLSAAAPKLYEDRDFLNRISETYGVQLRDAQVMSIFGKLADNADVVARVFEDVMAHAKKLYPAIDFIFFVDEIDKMEDTSGLGELVKNANSSRFVFVGIADTLDEIMRDHQSAFRRITGGIESLEPMRPKEVRSLFRGPLADYATRVPPQLIDSVVKYSGGIPWLVHVAGESIMEQLENTAGSRSGITFKEIWNQTEKEWEKSFGAGADFEVLTRETNRKVLTTFVVSSTYLSDSDVTRAVAKQGDGLALTTVRASLSDLEQAGILRRRGSSGTYRFADPIVRAFAFERIERLSGTVLKVVE
jgi:hypothetical protein